ncbi:NF-X1-type zinc finger protein NFXL1 [Glycine soja]|uniref:NF-X1-type zinc finger protein NFXL1 n=1 Tax=Glycine soja TaxID=3848 RepID=A0A0B2SLM4_GLYSO|nr:NF-X1-type zinc finger protein NFXL1 [Glycine soja]
MSSQIRRERREWSRVPPQGATRQEWVPRGAAAAAASTNVAQPSNLHSNNNADAGSSNLGVAVAAPSVSRSRSNNHGNDVGSSNQGVAVAALPVSRGRSNNHGNDAGFSNQGVAVAALPVSHGRSNNHGNDAGPSNQGVAVAALPVSHGRSNNPGNGAGSSNQGLAVAAPPVNRGRSKNHGKDSVSSNQGVAVAALASRGRSNNHGSHWMEMEKDKGSRSGSQVEKGLRVGVRDSSLPQLVQEIQEKLMKGTVECMICYEMVQRSVPVWSCSSCYSIFHLNCIKKWARAPISSDLSLSVEKNHELNWRCPGCHGHCPPCFQTIFNELACACGRTSIPPPLPCGTPPPSCQLPCSVPQPCGHSVSHSCHFGDCPPCSVPVAKECIGGHVVLRNIPCGSKDIRCNHPCGKTRQCGLHACGRTCHPPPCDNLSGVVQGFKAPCGQTCGAPRRSCRHTCMAPCHPSSPCPDIRCEFPVTITCSCGRITANVPCDVGGSSSNYNADAIHEASIIQTLPVPLQPVDANGKKVPLGQRKLICDDECSKLERKRVLADAFDITAPNLDSLHFGDNSLSSELLLDFFRREPKWVLAVEERCKILVLGKTRGTGTTHGLKVHIFCPMLKEKRDAVRLIADRWKLAITAAGWEPKRFIVISVTPKSKAPARVIGVKGTTTLNVPLPPVFDPLVDMDLRLVVSFPDLPRDTEINSLVLRFGGECELVWLNDKNALAVFHDPARAATAMRRLDYATVYQGAVLVAPNAGALVASSATNAWGGAGAMKGGGALPALKGNSWKKAVAQDSGWEDSWGGEEWIAGSVNIQPSVWKKEAPLAASLNRWNVLEQESSSSLSSTTVRAEVSGKKTENAGEEGGSKEEEKLDAASEVVDDWEKAYE